MGLKQPHVYVTRRDGLQLEWDTPEGSVELCIEECGGGYFEVNAWTSSGDEWEGPHVENLLGWLKARVGT